MMQRKFRNALVSVSDKTGLVELLRPLQMHGLRIVSTGGTAQHLRDAGLTVVEVQEQTGFPEVMDGRVKTLHPRVHMGLLARTDNPEDMALLKEHDVEPFDLVVVNLYPFEKQLAQKGSQEDLIEYIDVGGPSMLRAAAKNFASISVVCDPQDYAKIVEAGPGDLNWRRHLASKVFAHVSSYDAMIATSLGLEPGGPQWALGGQFVQSLRYGENPHQTASWYRVRGGASGLHEAKLIQGKELSYNNILDLDAAVTMAADFETPCAVAVKHTNPCGVAIHASHDAAIALALAADPVSVFGGIVAVNFAVTESMVEQLQKIFLECVVAPSFTAEALKMFAVKKNLRVLEWPKLAMARDSVRVRSVLGGLLVQSGDTADSWESEWQVLGEAPNSSVREDLLLAWRVASRLKSNAIAIAGGGRTLGLGMGQVNRVDSVAQAISRWHQFHGGEKRAVLASDAFFPFADSIEKIAAAGIKFVIQPGGSVKDEEVKAAAKSHGVTMILTGRRHFSH